MSEQSLLDGIPPDQIKEKPTAHNFRDLEGQQFGRLLVVAYAGRRKAQSVWWCRCDCGGTTAASLPNLHTGSVQSCGCLGKERRAAGKTAASRYRGASREQSLWWVWQAIVARCEDSTHKQYSNYGGRGIGICPEWREDPWAFYAHVKTLPHYREPGRSLDRIDNDRGYAPGNLRWATLSEQMRNTRATRWLTRSDGKTLCLTEWAASLGISPGSLHNRINVLSWTQEEALWTPKGCARCTGPVD